LAAALLLAPQAIGDGTLFLASPKTAVSQDFQEQGIIFAACEDAIKTVFINVYSLLQPNSRTKRPPGGRLVYLLFSSGTVDPEMKLSSRQND
jgi:hypothetical protein